MKNQMRKKWKNTIVIIIASWFFLNIAIGNELQQSAINFPKFTIVEPNTLIDGQPLSVWIQRYWRWERSFKKGESPSDDETGLRCNEHQIYPVFFLTGTTKNAAISRVCSISEAEYILIPLINVLAQLNNANPNQCPLILKTVREINDSVADLMITINGQSISIPSAYKRESGCFDLQDSWQGVSGQAAGAGYWLVLKSLDIGNYDLHFSGKYLADGYAQDIKYQLKIKSGFTVVDSSNALIGNCKIESGNSITTDECFIQILHNYNMELDKKYHEILSELSQRGKNNSKYLKARKQLIVAQKQWSCFRNTDCGALSVIHPNSPFCMIQYTKQRLEELKQWFN